MVIFKFSGHLRRFYSEVSLNVRTASQGLRLLLAQNHEFKKAFLNSSLKTIIKGQPQSEGDLSFSMNSELNSGDEVVFVPAVSGSYVAAAAIIIAVASVAYSIYSARSMKSKTSAESQNDNTVTNTSFGSAENRVGQGQPVPILLGRMVVGSNVISLGIDTTNDLNWSESVG